MWLPPSDSSLTAGVAPPSSSFWPRLPFSSQHPISQRWGAGCLTAVATHSLQSFFGVGGELAWFPSFP